MKKILVAILMVVVLGVANVSAQSKSQNTVAYNTQTYKYHKPNCKWAHKCTKNCIYIEKSEAIEKGGVPCKICGG